MVSLRIVFQESDGTAMYRVRTQILDTARYGLPQSRRRLYIVGQRKKFMARPFNFPAAVRLKVTAKSLLGRPSEPVEFPTSFTALKNLVAEDPGEEHFLAF